MLCLGHGLSGSLISLAANQAEFRTDVTGFVMAGYSAGLLVSALLTPRLVRNVGHVRTFAGLASTASTAMLLFPAVGRSRLLVPAARHHRALRLRHVHRLRELAQRRLHQPQPRPDAVALHDRHLWRAGAWPVAAQRRRCLGLRALHPRVLPALHGAGAADPAAVGGAECRRRAPRHGGEIWRASPLAVVGVLACGLGQSAFFALGVVFGLAKGLPLVYVSIMMALPPLGVILSQYPIGWISDRFDRRTIIMLLSVLAAVICAVTHGGRLLPVVAHAHLARHRLRRHLAADLFAGRRPRQRPPREGAGAGRLRQAGACSMAWAPSSAPSWSATSCAASAATAS